MKNSIETIENRTCDLPACSAVPQPTAPPHALLVRGVKVKVGSKCTHAHHEGMWGSGDVEPYIFKLSTSWR
jgi:hypothetical protein